MPVAIIVGGILFAFALTLWLILTRRRTESASARDYAEPQRTTTADAGPDISQALQLCVPQRFVVFDLETTGLDPARHEIIEIGAIKFNRGSSTHDGLQCLVKPRKAIPKMITKINGISQAMVDQEGQSLEQALKEFVGFIEDLPLVSFNAEFDMGFSKLQRSAMA